MISIEKAVLYEKYRLPYAGEAVRELVARVGESPVVADIGAGTGQLARLFAEHCSRVYAVEPDPAMREVATSVLAVLSNVEVREGSAERTKLTEDSIDLIVVGNAFHRFKAESCNEMRRILKRSGWVALFGYAFADGAIGEELSSRLTALKGMGSRVAQASHAIPLEALFGTNPIHRRVYPQTHTEDWTEFFGAACAGLEAPDRTDPEFFRFETLHREVFDAFAVNGRLRIAYDTHVSFGQACCLE